MKKIFSFLFLMVLTCSVSYAGPWVVGVNQIVQLFNSVEVGCDECDVPPVGDKWISSINPETGVMSFYTDLSTDDGSPNWTDVPGITVMENNDENKALVTAVYSGLTNNLGLTSINFADKHYKQKEGTTIQLIEVGQSWDYPSIPAGYASLNDYFDRNDIRWIESIDFSGNDFHSIEISGGPYNIFALKTLNLADNPNLTSLSVTHCSNLELVDVRGTGLSAQDIEWLKEDVQEYSPNAEILTGPGSSINTIDPSAIIVSLFDNTINIKNKADSDKVEVYDVYGHLLMKSYAETLDVSSFAKGIYLVKVNSLTTKVFKK